jgi:AhpD family alkylhydroperoxidase
MMDMKPRIEYAKVAPDALAAMRGLETYVHGSGLEPGLLELVKVRASQMNECTYCLDMHTKDARAAGEKEQRLYAVAAWREAPFFSERERAALAWTEAVTVGTQWELRCPLARSDQRHRRGSRTQKARRDPFQPRSRTVVPSPQAAFRTRTGSSRSTSR